jgi:hypothetical protein
MTAILGVVAVVLSVVNLIVIARINGRERVAFSAFTAEIATATDEAVRLRQLEDRVKWLDTATGYVCANLNHRLRARERADALIETTLSRATFSQQH